MSHYESAQVCLNGHMVTSSLESSPEMASKFCSECGAKTYKSCAQCGAHIRGYYHMEGVVSLGPTRVPAYCHECGTPYPWTTEKLKVAHEMADELGELSLNERDQLKSDLEEIARGSPKSELAAMRFKKLLAKVSGNMAAALGRVAIDVASEAAKKLLLG